MNIAFYITAAIAVLATAMVITRLKAVHALLYLVVSLLATSVLFFLLGAAFIAALEVMIYAGAIMVLFVFVLMMLNLGEASWKQEREWLSPKLWIGPGVLSLILLAEVSYVMIHSSASSEVAVIEAQAVGVALFGPYVLAVELAAMVLVAATIGAHHIGREKRREYHRFLKEGQ